jgi:hypothetical protein
MRTTKRKIGPLARTSTGSAAVSAGEDLMEELGGRGKIPAHRIDAPVSAIPISRAADLAQVPHVVMRGVLRTGTLLAMRDRSGRLFVSRAAVRILADSAVQCAGGRVPA